MKKQFTILAVLVLAVFITACGGNDQDTAPEVPPAPETPEEPTDSQDTTDGTDSGTDTETDVEGSDPATTGNILRDSENLGGDGDGLKGSKINSVACDLEERKITFTFENTGEHSWSIDQEVGFATGGDLKNVKIFMNHRYEMNGNQQYYTDSGDLMFGPNERFSDNCGGVTELATGDTATCTVYPVPLNRGTGSEGLNSVNNIMIDSPNVDEVIEFTC